LSFKDKMKKILSDKLPRILKNKKKLEKDLNVKITNRGKEVFIEGSGDEEYYAEKVIDAINFGFRFNVAIMLGNEDFIFEILNIKDYTKRKDLSTVRARIIGKGGRALKTLQNLTDCFFEIKDNKIGIIGNSDNIEHAQEAVVSLIHGSKHSNVYSFLEKRQSKPIDDLGLK